MLWKANKMNLRSLLTTEKNTVLYNIMESQHTNRDVLYINSDNISYAQKYIEDARL